MLHMQMLQLIQLHKRQPVGLLYGNPTPSVKTLSTAILPNINIGYRVEVKKKQHTQRQTIQTDHGHWACRMMFAVASTLQAVAPAEPSLAAY